MEVNKEGYVSNLTMKDDPYQMNWMIEDSYLQEKNYKDADKLFGFFELIADKEKFGIQMSVPVLKETEKGIEVVYEFETLKVKQFYDLGKDEEALFWSIELENKSRKRMNIKEFGIWISFAYVMFRDKNVLKNIHNSAAVFPFISKDYTKLNMVRRDGSGESLGFYQIKGQTKSVGTYCDYLNLFFEDVSPSLDGMLFHKLYLAGGYPEGFKNHDWIYEKDGFNLEAGEKKNWQYVMSANQGEEDFYKEGLKWRHPKVEYTPLNIIGEMARISVKTPEGISMVSADAFYKVQDERKKTVVEVCRDKKNKEQYQLIFKPSAMGEHKIVLQFDNDTEDFVVFNVMDKSKRLLKNVWNISVINCIMMRQFIRHLHLNRFPIRENLLEKQIWFYKKICLEN